MAMKKKRIETGMSRKTGSIQTGHSSGTAGAEKPRSRSSEVGIDYHASDLTVGTKDGSLKKARGGREEASRPGGKPLASAPAPTKSPSSGGKRTKKSDDKSGSTGDAVLTTVAGASGSRALATGANAYVTGKNIARTGKRIKEKYAVKQGVAEHTINQGAKKAAATIDKLPPQQKRAAVSLLAEKKELDKKFGQKFREAKERGATENTLNILKRQHEIDTSEIVDRMTKTLGSADKKFKGMKKEQVMNIVGMASTVLGALKMKDTMGEGLGDPQHDAAAFMQEDLAKGDQQGKGSADPTRLLSQSRAAKDKAGKLKDKLKGSKPDGYHYMMRKPGEFFKQTGVTKKDGTLGNKILGRTLQPSGTAGWKGGVLARNKDGKLARGIFTPSKLGVKAEGIAKNAASKIKNSKVTNAVFSTARTKQGMADVSQPFRTIGNKARIRINGINSKLGSPIRKGATKDGIKTLTQPLRKFGGKVGGKLNPVVNSKTGDKFFRSGASKDGAKKILSKLKPKPDKKLGKAFSRIAKQFKQMTERFKKLMQTLKNLMEALKPVMVWIGIIVFLLICLIGYLSMLGD